MGTKYMQIKRYASTIIYYMRAGKDESLKAICNIFLTQYVESGKDNLLKLYIYAYIFRKNLNNLLFN